MQLPCRRVRRPRRVSLDMGRRPLVRRRWRRGYGVSQPYGRDASLATATTSNATTVSASMQDAFSVPSCPANVPEVSRDRRLPCLMSTSPATGRMAHRVRSAPAARRSSGMAHPCPRGCISRRSSAILAYRATAIWHLGVAIHEAMSGAPAPDFHRLSGLPVCRDGSRPRRRRAAPTWPLQ